MRYKDSNFQRMQDRQKQNPKESKRDFLIRAEREKKQLRFYKETAHKIYDIDSWHCLTEDQRSQIMRSHNITLGFDRINFVLYGQSLFSSEQSWIEYVKETYKPNQAALRARALKKIGI